MRVVPGAVRAPGGSSSGARGRQEAGPNPNRRRLARTWPRHRRVPRLQTRSAAGIRVPAHRIDDHSRLAYTEEQPDGKGCTAAAFWGRAKAFFAAHGIEDIQRVLTDNGPVPVRRPPSSATPTPTARSPRSAAHPTGPARSPTSSGLQDVTSSGVGGTGWMHPGSNPGRDRRSGDPGRVGFGDGHRLCGCTEPHGQRRPLPRIGWGSSRPGRTGRARLFPGDTVRPVHPGGLELAGDRRCDCRVALVVRVDVVGCGELRVAPEGLTDVDVGAAHGGCGGLHGRCNPCHLRGWLGGTPYR